MSFCPSLLLVSLVRRFVGSFYEQVLSDADLVSRMALATHELLENAVKYSVDGEANVRIEIKGRATDRVVSVRTRNRAAPNNAAVLAKNIDEMNELGNPFTFYQGLMTRSARSGTPGGLGLGRVASEAEMKITYSVSGETVEVTAEASSEPS